MLGELTKVREDPTGREKNFMERKEAELMPND
jgi:hypothetical protein